MKKAMFTLILLCGCSVPHIGSQQEKALCQAYPSVCKTRVIQLPQDELSDLNKAKSEADAAYKSYQEKENTAHKIFMDVVKKNNIPTEYYVLPSGYYGSGPVTIGGTCLGYMEMTENGFLVLHAPMDAGACFVHRGFKSARSW